MPLSLAFFALFFTPQLLSQAALPVEPAHFTVSQGTHAVGRSDLAIQATQGGGFRMSSHGAVTLPNTKYSFSLSGSLSPDWSIVSEDLNGIVNGSAVTFAVRPSAANLSINISANGRAYQNALSAPARTIFLPDFDLGGYQALLGLLAAHPAVPVSALLPKQTGILSAATIAMQPDAQAALDGVNINVHHLSLTLGTAVSELYYSSDNRVLEVDVPGQTFAMVRDNFKLQPPPPPPANENQTDQQTQPQ